MARKLAISNSVLFGVTLAVNDGKGGTYVHKFDILADRRDSAEMRRAISDDTLQVDAFLCEVVKGWEKQRLVVEEDGTPSVFSEDAFRDLLTVAGAPALIFQNYLKAVTAKEKN